VKLVARLLAMVVSSSFLFVPASSIAAPPTTLCGHAGPVPPTLPGSLHIGFQPTMIGLSKKAGHVFIINVGERNQGGRMVCRSSLTTLDARSGRYLGSWALGEVPAGLVVDDTDGFVFVISAYDPRHKNVSEGYLDIFDLNGHGARGARTIDLSAGDLYQAGADGRTHRLFLVTYQSVMTFDIQQGAILRTVPIAGIGPGGIHAPLAIDVRDNRVFIPTRQGVSVLDARSGSIVQSITLPPAERTLTLDKHTGHVFVASTGDCYGQRAGELRTLDAATGATVSTVSLNCSQIEPTVVDTLQGVVLAGATASGRVAVVSAGTGRVIRTLPFYRNLANSAVDDRTGFLYIPQQTCTGVPAHCRDSVLVIDPIHGRTVTRISVGHAYQGLTMIAEPARRVYITVPPFNVVTVLSTVG